MKLGFNLNFDDLDLVGLEKLDKIFLNYLLNRDILLHNDILELRSNPHSISEKYYSEFLLKISPHFNDFLAELFNISKEVKDLKIKHDDFSIIYECKRKFIERYALKKYSIQEIKNFDIEDIHLKISKILGVNFTPRDFATQVTKWLLDEEKFKDELDIAARYGAYLALENNPLKDILFTIPQKIDESIDNKKLEKYLESRRIDFDYFDISFDLKLALNDTHYCIYCHKQGKDTCSKGLNSKFSKYTQEGKNGCPLKQKISEMNYVKAQGFNLSALAIIIIDNPMVAVTGHRICNDCSKSCIYQKQDPVNIPLIESSIFKDTLKLPYGVEIYILLTRWNPLNIYSPLPKKLSNYNILVTGLGPAGFSLSYYLLRSGHNVVAIDGLKLSPLDFDINKPIKYWDQYKQQLSKRIPKGFGGVAEYGITVRWDKNNLDILRVILERYKNFKYYSAVRLGANITTAQAFELGFDHIAFCIGAAKPKILELENFDIKGVRVAADFLMTLQSGGAFLTKSNTNMLIRMPIAVIGGGLTAVDAAVEALYYYKVQVERFLHNYRELVKKYGEDYVQNEWNDEDKEIANEFIKHALLLQDIKDSKVLKKILKDIGGSTIYYHADIKNSKAYSLNHEELLHAMSQGVQVVGNMNLLRINADKNQYVESLEFSNGKESKKIIAKTVLVAIGTEQAKDIEPAEKYTYLGDCNPKYTGSVVKALASSKESYQDINRVLSSREPNFNGIYKDFFAKLDNLLVSKVKAINILHNKVKELIIYSPLIAKNFKQGQIFRLQNYSNDITKLIEPLALTGHKVNKKKGLIHFMVHEKGISTSLCTLLLKEELIALMGPVGNDIEISKDKRTVFINYYNEKYTNYNGSDDDKLTAILEDFKLIQAKNSKVNKIIVVGPVEFIEKLQNFKKCIFGKGIELIVSVNTLMQCMMQGVCGQCILKVKTQDKMNSKKNYVFACSCQYHNIDMIDFTSLKNRLTQNSLQEKLPKCNVASIVSNINN